MKAVHLGVAAASALLLAVFAFSFAGSAAAITTVTVNIPVGASNPSGAPGYSPDNVTVVIGVNNTVMWVNQDSSPHTVTANDNSFDSGNLNPGATFIYTFNTPGTFSYHCIYHSWMKGTVVVKGSAVPEFPNSTLALTLSVTALAAVLGAFRFTRRQRTVSVSSS
jgi:plastocyanin